MHPHLSYVNRQAMIGDFRGVLAGICLLEREVLSMGKSDVDPSFIREADMKTQYWTYQQMWETLRELQRTYPDFMTVEVIGQSRQGRDMPGVTLSHRATGAPEDKSALFVDANIHAGEVAGNAVSMYWIQWCLENYETKPDAHELLDHHTLYIVPRIALDGAELYLTTPHRVRSSPHPYPYSVPPDGFVEADVDGDGHILMMRVPALQGAYAIDEVDPRIMRPRLPGEFGGRYYHVFPEGKMDRQAKAPTWPVWHHGSRANRQGMDFNRNFPIRWAGETGQAGAGPHPLSEPELQNLVRFILAHPNIAAYVALHTSGGVILRQPSLGEDHLLSRIDRTLFTEVAHMGKVISGYEADSNYHVFASGHEKVLMPGAADDWMYDHLGVLAFTVEIWNLGKHAGAHNYAEQGVRGMMALDPETRVEDERKIYEWVSQEVPDDGFFPWKPFEHPDFGPVEIGGLNPKFVEQNPPVNFLSEECAHVSGFLTRLGLCTAKMVFSHLSAQEEAPGIYRIVAEVTNAGYLPTSSTQKGAELMVEELTASITGSFELLSGQSPLAIPHLEGYGGQDAWRPPAKQHTSVEWVVRSQPGTWLEVRVGGPRAGYVQQRVQLEGV